MVATRDMIASTTRKNEEVDFQGLKTTFLKDGRFILPVSVSLSLSTDKARIIIGWVGDLLVVNYEWSEIPPPHPTKLKGSHGTLYGNDFSHYLPKSVLLMSVMIGLLIFYSKT